MNLCLLLKSDVVFECFPYTLHSSHNIADNVIMQWLLYRTNSVVSEGDTVSVWAQPEGQAGCWVVGNKSGLLVTHPDMLVSGTTVVGSLFCPRRAVLSDMYRGIDSDSSIMAVGCFLHELLQEVLTDISLLRLVAVSSLGLMGFWSLHLWLKSISTNPINL